MPRVIKRTPEWLIPPAPARSLFSSKHDNLINDENHYDGPLRTIAKGRGSEVFVAAGTELRWADLGALKQEFKEMDEMRNGVSQTSWHYAGSPESAYRVLKIPGSGPITQLVTSPEKEYIAIVRSHQIYIAILPDLRHLNEAELGPYKLKCFHLGPTIHCIEEATVISALWHPLGELGRCLVTVTTDAVVRLWEVNKDDRSTFEQPSTALDLKKLVNAISADQDFSASKFGSAKGFTPDFVELQPAAVCFGGRGLRGENPWHAATLWLATKGGDVYALCPLFPRRFETAADFIDTLSTLVIAKKIEAEEDRTKLPSADTQAQFLAQLQDQEPILAQGTSDFDARYVWSRPSQPGPAPKLQGPFEIDPDPEEEQMFADIYVTPFETAEDLGFDDDVFPGQASLVCLLTKDNLVMMTIDFDGIDAQWVPTRGTPFSTPKARSMILPDEFHTLIQFEVIQLPWSNSTPVTAPPSFTPDVATPHAFFVTDATGVHYVSASSWIKNIQAELVNPDAAEKGTNVRLDVFLDSAKSLVEQPISFAMTPGANPPKATSCIVFADGHPSRSGLELGYFVLTTRAGEPYAAQLDISDLDLNTITDSYDEFSTFSGFSTAGEHKGLILTEPRDTYRPDPVFDRASEFPNFIRGLNADRRTAVLLREDVDLHAEGTVTMMIDAHKVVHEEWIHLNQAANVLFTQCARLQNGLKDQIRRARELKESIGRITGDDDESGGDGLSGYQKLERRIGDAKARQQTLTERLDRLKGQLGKVSTRELSDKEKAWSKEIADLDRKLVTGEVDEEEGAKASGLMNRVMKVTTLSAELAKQARDVAQRQKEHEKGKGEKSPERRPGVKVPEGFRKKRVEGIMELLERERVLVDRATEKFEKLKVG